MDNNINKHKLSPLIIILQLFAWILILNILFSHPSQPDGIGYGIAAVYVGLPLLIFIFIINLYLIFRKNLFAGYRYIGGLNICAIGILYYTFY